MALRKEEATKTPHEKVKAKLQEILDVMNDYMRKNPTKIDADDKARIKNIKTIAKAIYDYYSLPSLYTLFESNLADMLNQINETKTSVDTSQQILLPGLLPAYAAPAMPKALHAYHDIKITILKEIENMWSMYGVGGSSLATSLQNIVEGPTSTYDSVGQELATNVYFTIYDNALKMAEIFRKPQLFLKYIYEALSPIRALYTSCADDPTKNIFTAGDKNYLFFFSESKKEAEKNYRKTYEQVAMVGAQFSYFLQKDAKNKQDPGRYVPLLSSIHNMDAQKDHNRQIIKGATFPAEYEIEKDRFVIPTPK